jgi:hypothetical protein
MVLLVLLEALAAERCCEDEAEACSRMLDTPCEGFRGLFVVGVGRRLEDSFSLGRALRVLVGSLRWPSGRLLLALFQYVKKSEDNSSTFEEKEWEDTLSVMQKSRENHAETDVRRL